MDFRTILLPLMLLASPHASSETISLAGEWAIALGKAPDEGSPQTINLPGSLQNQGFGLRPNIHTEWTTNIGKELIQTYLKKPAYKPYLTSDADSFKMPFWLTPERHYVGEAWYEKSITVPASWQDKVVTLYLERPHWFTTVYLDGEKIGSG